jgi:hypothetical protein
MVGYCASSFFIGRAFVYPMFFLFGILGALPAVAQTLLPDDHPPLIRVGKDLFFWGTVGSLGSILYIYLSIVLLNKAGYSGY